MNYFRKFVQKDAKSFATRKYCICFSKSSILRLGKKGGVELGQLGSVFNSCDRNAASVM